MVVGATISAALGLRHNSIESAAAAQDNDIGTERKPLGFFITIFTNNLRRGLRILYFCDPQTRKTSQNTRARAARPSLGAAGRDRRTGQRVRTDLCEDVRTLPAKRVSKKQQNYLLKKQQN